jgi:hypothetical protein
MVLYVCSQLSEYLTLWPLDVVAYLNYTLVKKNTLLRFIIVKSNLPDLTWPRS